MSQSLNEAYARIDYGMITKLQNAIADLAKSMKNNIFSTIIGNNYSVKSTRIFGTRFTLAANEEYKTVSFGGSTFADNPVVTATAEDNSDTSGRTATIILRKLTKNNVRVYVKRKTTDKRPITIHLIAVGENGGQ